MIDAMKHEVHFLDGTRGWQATNLGEFDTPDEAHEASRHWLDGYASTHGGHKPPVSVRPVHNPTPTPATP